MADIVTLTDDTAREVVKAVINAAWNQGITKQAQFEAKIGAAQTTFLDTATAPQVSAGSVSVPTITAPNVAIPTTQSASDVMTLFDSKYFTMDLRARYQDRLAERRARLADLARAAGWHLTTHDSGQPAQPALLWMYRALETAL